MPVSSRMLVEAPLRESPPFGLFSVISFRAGEDRWEGGVEWEQTSCVPLAPPVRQGCGMGSSGLPKQFEPGGSDLGSADPFTVYGSYACVPTDLDHGQQVATQRLLRGEEAGVTAVLVELIVSMLDGPPAVTGTDPAVGLGMAETALSSAGTSGMLIMDRPTLTTLIRWGWADAEGGRMVTLTGATPIVLSPVLLDPPGLILAAPLPLAYRSEIFTSSSRPGDLLDRGDNTLYAIAERSYLVGVDECGIGSATVRLGVDGGMTGD